MALTFGRDDKGDGVRAMCRPLGGQRKITGQEGDSIGWSTGRAMDPLEEAWS